MTIAELVAASRRAQGLPPTIEDAGTIARVAAILRTGHDGKCLTASDTSDDGRVRTPGPARRRSKAAA